jgi:hypothetical protein
MLVDVVFQTFDIWDPYADLHNIDIASEYWGKRGRVGIVPLINNQAYWFIKYACRCGFSNV